MADTSLFSRLQRLFSTNVIVRNVGGRKLKISDTSRTQATAKSNLVDRYQKIFTGAGLSGYSDALMTKSMRLNLFKDYDEDYKYELENIIEKTTRTFALNNQNQKDSIIDAVKISCRKITKEITGKKPLTSIKLIRI